jgi:hypothetical protein
MKRKRYPCNKTDNWPSSRRHHLLYLSKTLSASHPSSLQALLNLAFKKAWLILLAISLIGALIWTAQLRQWGWFIALWFLLPIIPYIFYRPDERKTAYSTAACRYS